MIFFAKALVKKSREVVITPKESVEIQLNGEYPTVADLFTKIKNYNPELLILDYNGLDISEIGDINELNKFGVYTINNKTVAYSKYDKHKNIY